MTRGLATRGEPKAPLQELRCLGGLARGTLFKAWLCKEKPKGKPPIVKVPPFDTPIFTLILKHLPTEKKLT